MKLLSNTSQAWLAAVLLSLILGASPAHARDSVGRDVSDKRRTVIVEVDGDCDEEVWQRAWDFWNTGDPEQGTWAKTILVQNLQHWDSYCKSVIKRLLEGLGKHKIGGGIEILARYLSQDLELPWAETIAAKAAKAIAEYGSESLGALSTAAGSSSERVAAAAVLGLGRCGDRRAIPFLKSCLTHPSSEVRHNGWVALSHYCPDSYSDLAVGALSSTSGDVRGGATIFLAMCGSDQDMTLLADLLTDPFEVVRIEALKGLIGQGSPAGCQHVPALLNDDAVVVRELAVQYDQVCASQAVVSPSGKDARQSEPANQQ